MSLTATTAGGPRMPLRARVARRKLADIDADLKQVEAEIAA